MRNRLSAVAAALLTAGLLAGCSSQTPEQELKAAAPAEWKAYQEAEKAYQEAEKTIPAEVETTQKAYLQAGKAYDEAQKAMAPAEWKRMEGGGEGDERGMAIMA